MIVNKIINVIQVIADLTVFNGHVLEQKTSLIFLISQKGEFENLK